MKLDGATIPIRARSLPLCLDLAVAFCQAHFGALLALVLRFAVPCVAVSCLLAWVTEIGFFLGLVLFFVVSPALGALLVAGVGPRVFGEPFTVNRALAFFRARSGRVLSALLWPRIFLALGGLLYPMLTRERYPPKFALGLVTAGGSMGLLLPPSLAVLLYGVVAQVNIEDLFVAGLLPTLLLLALVGAYAMLRGARDAPRHAFAWGELAAAARAGWADLLLPLLVIGGLAGGVLTVAELAAVTAGYALALETLIHRKLGLTAVVGVMREAAVLVGTLFVILGISLGLTNLLIDAEVPMRLLEWVQIRVDTPLEFLLWLNAALLVVGCMMDIFSAIVIVTPLLLPLATHFGVHPVHLGIVILANLEIGYITPPVGINLFLASQRFQRPVWEVFRASLPFLGLLLAWLALLTYVPAISLWGVG